MNFVAFTSLGIIPFTFLMFCFHFKVTLPLPPVWPSTPFCVYLRLRHTCIRTHMTGRNMWQVYAIEVGCPSCQNILKEKLKAFLDKEQILLRLFPVAWRRLIPRLFTYFCLCRSLVHDDTRPGQSLESPVGSARCCPASPPTHPPNVSGLPPCFLLSSVQRKQSRL